MASLIVHGEPELACGLARDVRDQWKAAVEHEPGAPADRLDADDAPTEAVPGTRARRLARDDDVVGPDAEEREVIAWRWRLGDLDVLVSDPQVCQLVRRALDAGGDDVLDPDERCDLRICGHGEDGLCGVELA